MRKYTFFATLLMVMAILFFVLPSNAALVGTTNQATLTASPQTGTYNPNDTFNVGVYLNTNGQNVVVVAAYLNYDKDHFQTVSIDTTGSAFSIEAEKIIDSINGVIKITRGNPSASHVNNSNALVATINFKALSGVTPSIDNLTFQFTAGSTLDSNVILDDGLGTEILSGVYNAKYTVSGGTVDTQAPTIPTNLSASAISSSQINLSWTASTDNVGVTGYKIYRGGSQIGTSPTNSYSNTGLLPSTAYSYTVAAYDAAGNTSGQSSSASATTQASADTQTPTVTAFIIPSTASSLTVSISSFTATDNVAVTGYMITESSSAPSASASGWSSFAPTIYTISDAGAKTLYAWAKDAAGNVSQSKSATATITVSSTLTVSLSANPNSGVAPLNGVDLTATVLGTATGDINYTFYCDRSDTGINITYPNQGKYDNISQTTYNAIDICNYSAAGTYTAKIISERGGYQAEARITISVTSSAPAPTPTPTPTPTSTPTPTPTTTPPPAPTPPPGSYPNGSVVKSSDDEKIYIIVNGQKRWLFNPEVFLSYGLPSGSQQIIPQSELNKYPAGPDITKVSLGDGSLIRAKGDFKVYIIKGIYKRHIFNPAIFGMYKHFSWSSIKDIDPEVVNSYATSDIYRADGDSKVYSLQEISESQGQAIKYHINLTPDQFTAKGYSWSQIFIVNAQERDYYQTGSPISQ